MQNACKEEMVLAEADDTRNLNYISASNLGPTVAKMRRWRSSRDHVIFTLRPLYPRGNNPWVPIVQEAGWATKRFFAPFRNRTPILDPAAHSLVAIPTGNVYGRLVN
jgi:hypothetical protein